ncbi:tripartite tricarboxylate transporter substrate binding protein [Siccirubricoccus sp. KC 17139]|uniref:Tripartite tricarboxylate transporter substrate binding protein n=1 Tax=Siccirubricoccus soli TaxID=2899147 RepID=A0ABT1D530_9PROT|nr:tripartite tricarboxylate transporter substrate binding protein [Siccirubricoccus soli]MCO6417035.1 tripartite tricarboxylate transporter substrate binding protein [Siccirubricoccus soli]MCP2683170.1 tripartite tricarboxylate transporter substrate binding protein [Siccirubricoccus soli]
MRITRRALAALALATPGVLPAWAQGEYPNRSVRLVVGYPPGGSTDLVARLLAERLAKRWGQPVVVENRAGASGALGADQVAKAPPDGHTLLLGASAEMAILQATMRNMPVDVAKDLAGITWLTLQPFLVLAHAGLPVDSLADVAAYARTRPGALNYGSFGNGTSTHLVGEMLRLGAGIDLTHVPYRGSGPLMVDLIAGQVQLSFDTIPSALPHLREKRLKALALCHDQRLPSVAAVPTVAEAGFPYLTGATWAVLAGPARLPEPIQAKLSADARAVMAEGLGALLQERGLEPMGATREETAAFLATEREKWAAIAARAEVRIE